MAYQKINPIVLPPEIGNAVNYTVNISSLGLTLVNDEWLLVFIACPNTSGTLSTTSSGWTEVAELDLTSGSRMGVYKCKVAGGTAANLVVDLSTGSGMWHGFIAQVPDANATDCISGTPSSTDGTSGGAAVSMTPAAYTPADDDCLIFYFGAARVGGSDPAIRFLSSDVVGEALNDINNAGGTYSAVCLGTRQQGVKEDASKVMYAANSVRMGTIIVAIKNKVSGAKSADCRAGITKMAWMGNFGVANESLGTSWGWPSTFCSGWPSGNINNVTADTAAAAISNTSAAYWGSKTRLTSTTTTAGAWCGGWIPTPATFDLTGKILSIEFDMLNIDYLVGAQGVCLALGDSASASTGNAVVYQLSPKQVIKQGTTYTAMIAVETATTIQAVGTLNFATINKIGFFHHRIGSSANAKYLDVKNILIHANSTMVGGNAARPLDIKYLNNALNGWGYRELCNLQGDAVMVKAPAQFGDGTITTYVNTSGTLLNCPEAYSTITQPLTNIPAGTIAIGVYASSGDTMKFISSSTASGQAQNFTINASSSASASYDFTGEAFSRWNMTWATNVPVSGATYSNCGTIAFKGADVTSCTISNTTAAATTGAACSWDANGAVVTSTGISCVKADGTSCGYHIELGASVTAITLASVTFTGTPGTDKVHVLKTLTNVAATALVEGTHYTINTVGTTDFTLLGAASNAVGVNFTKNATAGTGTGTADQAVKITVSGTTSLVAGDVTSAGATIWIAAPQPTLSATVLASSRVVLYNDTTDAELDNTAPAGTAWSKVIASGASINDVLTLHVFKEGYAEFSTSFLYSGADTSVLVSQVTDPVITAFRTEDSITDYTTITEFNIYAPTIYIQADDADGVSKISRLAIFYNGVLTTADGARYFRGGMSMLSTAAVRINKSVIVLLLENVSATLSLRFSDEATRRLYTDDGSSIIAPSSVPGSIEYAYGGVPDVVETGVSGLTGPESSQLMGLPSASTNAEAVATHSDTLTLGKFLALK